MPLFGFRKDKKHEQSHIQSKAGLAKNAAPEVKDKRSKGARKVSSEKPEKISSKVVTKDPGAAKSNKVARPAGVFSSSTDVIIRPRVTEKSGILSQSGVYTFEVHADANKQTVAKAIATLYKVTPVKVAMINTPIKNVFVKGRKGQVAGIRKALVTIKKGEKIDFV